MSVYHEWKGNRRCLHALDDPHSDEADELDKRKQVNSSQFNVAQVNVVRLILDWHQYNQ